MTVLAHDDVFAEGTTDTEWLPVAGKNRWVVLTKDKNIRYKPDEREALRRSGVRQFVLVGGNLTSDQMAAAFIQARSAMEELVGRRSRPFVARVTRSGEVSRVLEL